MSLFLIVGCSGTVPSRGEPIRVGLQDVSHEIPLERYVAGVLEKEVRGDWPLEALKAQAVATRTYAVYRKQNPRHKHFDVFADTSDQVFEKRDRHSESIVRAVMETEGETLTSDGRVFEAFFHSCCGGMSESAGQVWPGAHVDPLQRVHEDPYCEACPPAHWEYRLPKEELARLLAANGNDWNVEGSVEVIRRDASGRATEILLQSAGKRAALPATKFRQIVGNVNLKSTLFEIAEAGGEAVTFLGRGAGHGVGLCQWGAKGMADAGRSYREILEFYYPGVEIGGQNAAVSEIPAIDVE